jgi:preprotein translocase subunit SecE
VSPWTIAGLVLALVAAAALVVWRERVKVGVRASVVFVGEVTGEVQKVTWPDRQQLKNATLVILAFVALVALLIGVLDIVLQWLVVTLPGRVA